MITNVGIYNLVYVRKIGERKTICWLDYIFFVDDLTIGLYGWTNWIRRDYWGLVDDGGKKIWITLN